MNGAEWSAVQPEVRPPQYSWRGSQHQYVVHTTRTNPYPGVTTHALCQTSCVWPTRKKVRADADIHPSLEGYHTQRPLMSEIGRRSCTRAAGVGGPKLGDTDPLHTIQEEFPDERGASESFGRGKRTSYRLTFSHNAL